MDFTETIVWHEVKYREPTEEEKAEWAENYDIELTYFFDCPMPDDGDDILIATGVDTDVCGNDEGYYLENRGDWDDVIAWAEMPKYRRADNG